MAPGWEHAQELLGIAVGPAFAEVTPCRVSALQGWPLAGAPTTPKSSSKELKREHSSEGFWGHWFGSLGLTCPWAGLGRVDLSGAGLEVGRELDRAPSKAQPAALQTDQVRAWHQKPPTSHPYLIYTHAAPLQPWCPAQTSEVWLALTFQGPQGMVIWEPLRVMVAW